MTFRSMAALALLLTAIACSKESTDGLPDTDTTGTAQSPSTSTASATTTGVTGGTSTTVAPADAEWVTQAGSAGMAELQMGSLALQKAQSAAVKSFAQRMVADHTKAGEDLQNLVTAKGLALPAELDSGQKAGLDHLNMLSGAEFDRAYMQHMVADHEKAVTLFRSGANAIQDADIRGYASKNLPILQEHQKLAQDVSGKLK